MPQPLPPATDAPKKQASGCLLAFYIAAGLATVCIVTAVVGVWLFMRSERGQKIVRVVTEGATLVQEAVKAPGTGELRGAGCTQAMIFPTAQGLKLLGELAPDALKEIPSSLEDTTLVFCQIQVTTDNGEGPTCSQVARVYAGAVPEAPDRFAVMVQHQRQRQNDCQGSYARDGTFLGPLEPPKKR